MTCNGSGWFDDNADGNCSRCSGCAACRKGSEGLSGDELVIACKNIGYDLTCGQCASVFYTGSGTYPHELTCVTASDVSDVGVVKPGDYVEHTRVPERVRGVVHHVVAHVAVEGVMHGHLLPYNVENIRVIPKP